MMLRERKQRIKKKLRRQHSWRNAGDHHTVPELYSHHVFLLPFKWSVPVDKTCAPKGYRLPVTDDLEALSSEMMQDWDVSPFQLDTVANYNEWHYFFDYVREVLYETVGQAPDSNFVRHFRHRTASGGKYVITAPSPAERQADSDITIYTLEIDEVYLHLYYTGVGVLSFHLNNRDGSKSSPNDILYINQFGRRVFPAFYPIPASRVGKQAAFEFAFGLNGQPELQPHGHELAYEIEIELNGQMLDPPAKEDWSALQKKLSEYAAKVQQVRAINEAKGPNEAKELEPLIPNFDPACFCQPFLKVLNTPSDNDHLSFKLSSVLDDRMFVVCWYGNDSVTKGMLPTYGNGPNLNLKDNYKSDSWWYKFVHVDGNSITVENPEEQRRYISEATYLRWSQFGTIYGVTDYSFMLLTNSLPSLRKFNAEFVVTHLQSIYYKLVELTLVQRACVERFRDEVTHISKFDPPVTNDKDVEKNATKLARKANDLYRRYIRFVNGIYFQDVTAQIQGIELYKMLHEQSRLPTAVKALSEEIHELHNYVRQETDRAIILAQNRKEKLEKARGELLTLVGALFLAPALLVAVYDLGFFGECLKSYPRWYYPGTILAVVLSAGLAFWTFMPPKKVDKKSTKKKAGNIPPVGTDENPPSATNRIQRRLPWAVVGFLGLLLFPLVFAWKNCPPALVTTPLEVKVVLPERIAVPPPVGRLDSSNILSDSLR